MCVFFFFLSGERQSPMKTDLTILSSMVCLRIGALWKKADATYNFLGGIVSNLAITKYPYLACCLKKKINFWKSVLDIS